MRLLRRILDRVQSQLLIVVGKMSATMLCVAVTAHYMACYWYLLGIESNNSFGVNMDDTWIGRLPKAYDEEEDVQDLYLISLHWSLSQLGYAPSDIYPANTFENAFSSMSSLMWFLLQGLAVSHFTLWLLQMRNAHKEHVQEEHLLRRYLKSHRIPTELTEDVLKYFRMYSLEHMKTVHEEDVLIFKDLPVEVRVRLHREVYMPILKQHPLFEVYGSKNEASLLSVCHLTMVEHYYKAGTEVFTEGQDAKFMFYAVSGKFEYYCPSTKVFEEVEPFTWVNEPVLWRKWKQRGVLTAFSSSETVGLEASKFHAIMEEVEDNGFSIDLLRRYARIASDFYEQNDPDTDFWGDDDQLAELVNSVVRDTEGTQTMGTGC